MTEEQRPKSGVMALWNNLSLSWRLGILVGVFLVLWILIGSWGSGKKETFVEPTSARNMWPSQEGPAKWVARTEEQLRESRQSVQKLNQTLTSMGNDLKSLREQNSYLKRKIDEEANKSRSSKNDFPSRILGGAGENGQFNTPPRSSAGPRGISGLGGGIPAITGEPIKILKSEPGKAAPQVPPGETHPAPRLAWLPAGSVVRTKLVTGVDAPTLNKPPLPTLLSLSAEALGPSMRSIAIKGCLGIAEATGDLSSERAMIKVYRLSCVREDGSSISREISGYVVGEDGRIGIPGILVSRQGDKIFQSLLANFASGFGNAMAQNETTSSVTALGGSYSTLTGDALKYGSYRGFGKTADELASWLKDYAKQMVPVISVEAGRNLEIVFQKGTDLGETHGYAKNTAFSGLD